MKLKLYCALKEISLHIEESFDIFRKRLPFLCGTILLKAREETGIVCRDTNFNGVRAMKIFAETAVYQERKFRENLKIFFISFFFIAIIFTSH